MKKKLRMVSAVLCMVFFVGTFVVVKPVQADTVCTAFAWKCIKGDMNGCRQWARVCIG